MAVGASGEKDNTVLDSVSSNASNQPPKKNRPIDKLFSGDFKGFSEDWKKYKNQPRVWDSFSDATKTLASEALISTIGGGLISKTPKAIQGVKSLKKFLTKKPDIKIKNPSVIGNRQKIPSLENYPKQQPVISNVTKDGVATSVSKQTGKVDAVVTGTDNKNVVGLYRDYVKGKPTNDFTSKMELTNPDLKKNFKTILNNTLEKLPKNHRLIEKTSVSLDGLGVWNKFVKSGKYKEAVDASGKVLTKKVHLGELLEGVNKKITSKDIEKLKKLIKQSKSKYPGINAEIKKPWRNPVKLRGKNVVMGDSSIDIKLPILVPK